MKKLILMGIISCCCPHFIFAQQPSPFSLNISGLKTIESSYTKFKGNVPSQTEPEGINIKQSLRFLVAGGAGNKLNTHLNYDDTKEQPLEMLINYQGEVFSSSFGDLNIVLDETEFALYNKKLFGAQGAAKLNKFDLMTFNAKTKGVSKSKVYRGKIGSSKNNNFTTSNYIQRTYYQLLNENVLNLYVDDGIKENGEGFDLQQVGSDYILENGVLIFREPVEENSLVQVVYEISGTRTIKGPTISTELNNYFYVGYPNLIDGSEEIKDTSVNKLTRGTDYRIDYDRGIIQMIITPVDFTISFDYRVKDYQLDPPILLGSEKVKVDDKEKTRGVDYYINYETGILYFYDEHLAGVYGDSLVVIDYESSESSNLQNMLGLRGRYHQTENFSLGATYLSNTDAKSKTRPNIALSPLQHQIIGLDTQIQLGEHIKFSGEIAQSKKEPRDDKIVLIDDMERENLIGQNGRWRSLDKNVTLKTIKDTSEIYHPDASENHQVLRLEYGTGTGIIEQQLSTPINLSRYANFCAWFKSTSPINISIRLYSATEHYFSFDLRPTAKNQYYFVSKDLTNPTAINGNPRLDEINMIRIILEKGMGTTTIIYLDDLGVQNAKTAKTEEAMASKLEGEITQDKFNFKIGIKDMEKGFNAIGLSSFESISDTRRIQSQADINLWGPINLSLGYDEKLRDKSNIGRKLSNKIYSSSVVIEPSEKDNIKLEYIQEKEIDFKETQHDVHNRNNKLITSITHSKERCFGLNSYQIFTRLMRVETNDKAHNGHSNSNNAYTKLNLIPIEGLEFIPEYRYKTSRDIKKSMDLTKEIGVISSLNITGLKGITTIFRYTNEDLRNFLVRSEQKNQGKSIDMNMELGTYIQHLTPYVFSTFYESLDQQRLDEGKTTSKNESLSSNIKLKIAPQCPWDGLLQYQLTRQEEKIYLTRNETDNYLAQCNFQLHKFYPQFGRQVNLSQLMPKYEQRKTRQTNVPESVIDTYFLSWQTDWNKRYFTHLQYETKKEKTRTTILPYIKIKYSPFDKLCLSTEFREFIIKNENLISTTDYFTSMGIDYNLYRNLKISDIFRYSRNESNNKTIYSSALELNFNLTEKINAILRYNWSDVNDRKTPANNFITHQVNMNISAMF